MVLPMDSMQMRETKQNFQNQEVWSQWNVYNSLRAPSTQSIHWNYEAKAKAVVTESLYIFMDNLWVLFSVYITGRK